MLFSITQTKCNQSHRIPQSDIKVIWVTIRLKWSVSIILNKESPNSGLMHKVCHSDSDFRLITRADIVWNSVGINKESHSTVWCQLHHQSKLTAFMEWYVHKKSWNCKWIYSYTIIS